MTRVNEYTKKMDKLNTIAGLLYFFTAIVSLCFIVAIIRQSKKQKAPSKRKGFERIAYSCILLTRASQKYKNIMNYTDKEKEMFLAWSQMLDAEAYEKKVKEYFQAKKEIENELKK